MKLICPMLFLHYHANLGTTQLQFCCKFVANLKSKVRKPLILLDYSMIEATLPEPTVRPPSRSVGSVFVVILYDFMLFLLTETRIFQPFHTVFIFHRVTVGSIISFLLNQNYLQIFLRSHYLFLITAPA